MSAVPAGNDIEPHNPGEVNGVGALTGLCVIIPAWQPTAALPTLVADLAARGFGPLLIVDDGSGEAFQSLFQQVAAMEGVVLLRHAANRGKGRALKSAFAYVREHLPQVAGVVTADADGQHTPADIERVARVFLGSTGDAILGVRTFGPAVPPRSRIGNRLTRRLFALLTGASVSDTQTGLRALPCPILPELLALPGERYEYEMTVLTHLCRSGRTPREVPIATVYLDGNRGSHLHPVLDSIRILFALLRASWPPAIFKLRRGR